MLTSKLKNNVPTHKNVFVQFGKDVDRHTDMKVRCILVMPLLKTQRNQLLDRL